MFFSLLKGYLFSDGAGLISHCVLRMLMGIYGHKRSLMGFLGLDEMQGKMEFE
jgi:hypothetical protein